MPSILTSGGQNLIKNSYASAPSLDLTLICNGEEPTSIFDSLGNITVAGIDAPTTPPSVVDGGSGGVGVAGYVAYRYVYAATRRYPFVENITAAGGSVAPRSNPSPTSTPFLTVVLHKNTITLTKTTRSDISKIWIYRTATFATAILAAEASTAGQLFYLGEVNNDGNSGTITYTDNTDVIAGEQLEFDNFSAPTAAFCVFYEPYFYLFGNLPLVVDVTISYNTVGPVTTITLNDSEVLKWFKGRDGQFIKFAGVSVGGFDGFGTYYFKWLSGTTAQLVIDDLDANGYISLLGDTTATIYGFSTTLYRSKANNPFGWGKTVTIANLAIPELYTLKVGGGIGTGIAVMSNNAILKLDTENPSKCYSLNLKLQDDEDFESTLRVLSDSYSASINSTQFPTLTQNKTPVTWSLDLKNYSILESDGAQQVPISDNVFKFLRSIDTSEEAHRNYHGIFDPYTECNFIWVRESSTQPIITHCIYQHIPSGQWGMCLDFDITASAHLQDSTTNESLILGGTDTGIFGRLFKPLKFVNWLANPTSALPNSYLVSRIGVSANVVKITRITVIEQAEHLTFFKYYFFDSGLVQRSIFTFYDVGSTGDPAPAESVGFDVVIRVNVVVGDSIVTTLLNLLNAFLGSLAFGDYALNGNIPDINNQYLYLIGANNPGATISSADALTAYNTTVVNHKNGTPVVYATGPFSGQTQPTDASAEGTWALVETNNSGKDYVWIRILDALGSTLVYDSYYGDISLLEGITSTSVTTRHCSIYFGLTDCKFQKSFDLNEITKRKTWKEFWVAASEALTKLTGTSNNYYYTRKLLLGYNDQLSQTPTTLIIPNQDIDKTGTVRDMFFITPKNIPSNPFKSFGFTVIQRGYQDHQVRNMALKFTT